MGDGPARKPQLHGRGVVRVEDFCRHTGLDVATVEGLMSSGRIQHGLWKDDVGTQPFGLFDDELPSARDLADLGLDVRDDYDPDALRSSEMADEDPEDG